MTRNGKLLPLSQAASVLMSSAGKFWQGIDIQQYRLNPTECHAHASSVYSFVLQLSPPVVVEWQSHDRFHKRQMNPGDVSLHTIGELPNFRLHQTVELFEIVLMPQFIHQVLQGMGNTVATDLVSSYGITDPQIQRIAASLKAELDMGCPGGQLLGESLATALVVHAFTHYSDQQQVDSEQLNGLPRSDLQRVLAFICDNLAQDLTLSALAGVIDLSPHYFAMQFKQSIGVTPHQYVVQQRIEKAKRLLLNSNTSVAEISYSVGFTNQSHLNFHFKRVMGVTPGQYRRAAR